MKNRLFTFLMVSWMLSNTCFGQGDFGHVAPQTADFIRYGEIPVSLFTGKMNLEIPIYRIQDQDFDIPIRLLYTADGFKPERRADFAGLDWALIAGGCITREIYGSPDDFYATSSDQEDGFKWVLQDKKFQDKDKVWNMDPSVVYYSSSGKACYMQTGRIGYQDYQPDLFLFHFNGHSGQFMINNKGQGQANHPGYKVDISGLSKQRSEILLQPDTSTLRITTPDGYLYEFGGDLDAIEYSISYKEGYALTKDLNPTILAWHLTKITAPNGRFVKYNYASAGSLFYVWNPIWQAGRGVYKQSNSNSPGLGDIWVSATKKAILESIEVDNLKIEFKKSTETTLGTDDDFFTTQNTYNHAGYQLDTVIVKYDNVSRYTYVLKYENQSKRRFLSSVTQPDGSKYQFVYNHTTYPINMSPITSNSTNGPDKDDFGYWVNNKSDNSYGLMSQITYPTGGYSLFAYEKHQYNHAVKTRLSDLTKHLVATSNNSNNIHGARIKSITNYTSSSTQATKKEYIYTDKKTNGVGSGILYQSHPYYTTQSNDTVYIIESSWNKNYNIEESPIGYSSVIEKREDNSYILYKFTDYRNNPDQYNNTNFNIVYPSAATNYLLLAACNVNRASSNSDKRGLLAEKLFFDSNGLQKSQEQYLYKNAISKTITEDEGILICDCDPSVYQPDNSYIVSFRGFSGGGMSRKIYLKTHPQVQQKIQTDNVTSEEWYRYNPYDQLRSKAVVINPKDTLRTNYIYPTESTEWYSQELASQNRLSPVIEEIIYKASPNVSPIELKRIRKNYVFAKKNSNLIVPSSVQSAYRGGNEWKTDISYNTYNERGNVLQQTGKDEMPVSYLWSYNNQYPVIEIRNVTFSQVESKLSTEQKTILNSAYPTDANIRAIGEHLRSQLPHAEVITYTYNPLAGMTSKTSPRGVTAYYEYDPFGRLQYIKDENGKTIETYNYHYQNQ